MKNFENTPKSAMADQRTSLELARFVDNATEAGVMSQGG
jgi:hypothetical protein